MDYTTLIADKNTAGSIKNWVNRSDIPSTTIVAEALAWTVGEGKLRAREMVTEVEFIIDGGTNEEPLPSDFLDPIGFYPYGWADPLDYVIPQSLRVLRDETTGDVNAGDPCRWAIIGASVQTDSAPEDDYKGILTYYAQPAALVTTNFITVRFPSMFRHACLARAYSHMKQYTNVDAEEKMAFGLLEKINEVEELYLRGAQLW